MNERNEAEILQESIDPAAPTDGADRATAESDAADGMQKRREHIRQAALSANRQALEDSPGVISGALGERLYSINEMRQMTAKEVKGRYHTLLASLKRGLFKW